MNFDVCWKKTNSLSSPIRFRATLLTALLLIFLPVSAQTETIKVLPSLEESIKLAHSHHPQTTAELDYQVKENYYGIQVKYEQLKISEEVRAHFEKAVSEAEKKYEADDGDVTQSAITKLKLGLSGTLNDLIQFENDKKLFQLRLGRLLGREIHEDLNIGDQSLKALEFPYQSIAEYLAARKSSVVNSFELKEAMIEINKSKAGFELAMDSRKMTRALLVTEVANYDFGIGDEAELFEALIIYTRVLVGYFDALYAYNLSVSAFERIHAKGKHQSSANK